MIEKYLVKKITEPVDWKVTVPGSKSMTNRALLLAALSAGAAAAGFPAGRRQSTSEALGQRRVSLRRCSDFRTGVMRSAVQRR